MEETLRNLKAEETRIMILLTENISFEKRDELNKRLTRVKQDIETAESALQQVSC